MIAAVVPIRACRVCGCTDDRACIADAGPCHWVEADLCSACEESTADPARGFIVTSGDGKRFRRWEEGSPSWTEERDQATRYARRQDAKAVHREDEDAWLIEPFDLRVPAPGTLTVRLANCLARCIDTPLLKVRDVGHGGHLELTLGAFDENLADEACRLLEEAGR